MLLFATEKKSKVTSVVNFIPSKSWSLDQEVSQGILHTHTFLKVYIYRERESSRGSQFVIKSPYVCYKWSQARSISCTSLISFVTFNVYQSVPNINSK